MADNNLRRAARTAFDQSYRASNFCNWCGEVVNKRLIHHGDANPTNNDPLNLWALCGRSCHVAVHKNLLNDDLMSKAGKVGGVITGSTFGQRITSEEQSRRAKMASPESRAIGARVANAKKVQCSECPRVMNPGALGNHKKVHQGGGLS